MKFHFMKLEKKSIYSFQHQELKKGGLRFLFFGGLKKKQKFKLFKGLKKEKSELINLKPFSFQTKMLP